MSVQSWGYRFLEFWLSCLLNPLARQSVGFPIIVGIALEDMLTNKYFFYNKSFSEVFNKLMISSHEVTLIHGFKTSRRGQECQPPNRKGSGIL